MGISDTLLGRKNVDGNPYIEAIEPSAALPGGEVRILGKGLKPPQLSRPEVTFGGTPASLVVSSEEFIVARVPYGATSGQVTVRNNGTASNALRRVITATSMNIGGWLAVPCTIFRCRLSGPAREQAPRLCGLGTHLPR